MGMHLGLIAVKASVPELRTAFFETWRQFELVDEASGSRSADEAWDWCRSKETYVSAAEWTRENPGRSTYLFWQDGAWAVMSDGDYTIASDEDKLCELSKQTGTVLSLVVETAGGSAFFWCCQNGSFRRSIENSDGDMTFKGEPLPEEAGIDVAQFYMEESDALWRAFGLSPVEEIPRVDHCQAVCVVDHTDYGTVPAPSSQPSGTEAANKPWWKLW